MKNNTGTVVLCIITTLCSDIVALICAETLGPISYTEGEGSLVSY